MTEAKNKLDEILRREKTKRIQSYLALAACCIVLTLGWMAYSSGESTDVNAVVKGLHSQASESDERFYIFVAVESAGTITVEIPREVAVKPGDSVILSRRDTLLFGMKNYKLVRVNEGK